MRRIVCKFEHADLDARVDASLDELSTQLEGFGDSWDGLGRSLRQKLKHGSRADGQMSSVSFQAARGSPIEQSNTLHHFREVRCFLIILSHL